MANRRSRLIRTNPKLAQGRAYRRWTQGEDNQLHRECQSGMVLSEIARHHQRSEAGILGRAAKFGLPVNRGPAPGSEATTTERSVKPPQAISHEGGVVGSPNARPQPVVKRRRWLRRLIK